MQKKILAAAVAALCGIATTATAQSTGGSKVELWGIVDAAVRHTNNEGPAKKGLTKMVGGGMSQSRWGINVEEDLGGGSKAVAHLENRFNSDTGEKDATAPFFQLAYVGLQGPYGRLTMGRQWNVLFDVVSSTYASFPYSPYMDAYKPELGMAAGARTSNALKYMLATPDRSWVGTIQYSFAEGNKSTSAENAAVNLGSALSTTLGFGPSDAALPARVQGVQTALGNPSSTIQGLQQYKDLTSAVSNSASGAYKTAGAFLRYSKDGISVGGGFLRSYLPGGSDLDAWTFGGSYRSGPLYLNAGYGLNKLKAEKFSGSTMGDFYRYLGRQNVDRALLNGWWQGQTNGGFQSGDSNKRQMFKVGFGYQVTPQINAGLHFYHAKQSGSVDGKSNGKANFLVALANYTFSKRTDAYFGVDHTKVSGGSAMFIDSENKARKRTGITVGLRHRF